MSTKFFIGGNEFFDDEQAAEHALDAFKIQHGIPEGVFVIVKIDTDSPEEAPASKTVH